MLGIMSGKTCPPDADPQVKIAMAAMQLDAPKAAAPYVHRGLYEGSSIISCNRASCQMNGLATGGRSMLVLSEGLLYFGHPRPRAKSRIGLESLICTASASIVLQIKKFDLS